MMSGLQEKRSVADRGLGISCLLEVLGCATKNLK